MTGFCYLALDFDGVLHPGNPIDASQRYSRMPLLAGWLRRWPQVMLVISSDWRERSTLEELRSLFPADLGHRVLGTTPSLPAGPARREREIRSWLAGRGLEHANWAAIDDDASAFTPDLSCLVLCETGADLTSQSLRAIEERLHLRQPAAIAGRSEDPS
ncbi:HAD domain-containing protein [Paucibacter sp. R3-3]|uniref:HAD domain-containing protein n=1 Tax=Roseateles agri TaxID=3098619 RepID=A0ABU5DQZ0_9BURK|nr:HAD domain-containing protein [Paucibacter sp. R3-3]MDY0748731.1 HAD domain-containing protein [Paucibacter sp. R3-3]